MINTRALLRLVLSGSGCRHAWWKGVYPQERSIVCSKCGLNAYVLKPDGEMTRCPQTGKVPFRKSASDSPQPAKQPWFEV